VGDNLAIVMKLIISRLYTNGKLIYMW